MEQIAARQEQVGNDIGYAQDYLAGMEPGSDEYLRFMPQIEELNALQNIQQDDMDFGLPGFPDGNGMNQ